MMPLAAKSFIRRSYFQERAGFEMLRTHDYFDEYAEDYDCALAQGLAISGEDKDYFARGRIAWLARLLNDTEKPAAVMDFGCGTGSALHYFFELLGAQSVLGIDVSVKSLEVARRNHNDSRIQLKEMADYVPEEAVDFIFCNGVFHHVPPEERSQVVNYLYRSLKPGGIFAFWENNPWNPGTRYVMSHCPFDKDAITLTPIESRRLLRKGQFEVLRTDFLFIFPRVLRWFRVIEPMFSRLPFGAQFLVLARKPLTGNNPAA